MKQAIISICLLTLMSTAALADAYKCTTTQAVGFTYNAEHKEWRGAVLEPGAEYLVRRPEPGSNLHGKFAWFVASVGDHTAWSVCKDDFDQFGILRCSSLKDFQLNAINGRFHLINSIGYTKPLFQREGADIPGMAIGTCVAL